MADPLISVDDHVQEHPDVWTRRLSRQRWGDRIPHVERGSDGRESWVVDGEAITLGGVAAVGALLPDRTREPGAWGEVPAAAYDPGERLRAMDADGVDYSVLYPAVAGFAGETFARLADPDLELACVRAYNDWLVEEWASVSPRFVPQCIVPISPIEAAVAEIQRSVEMGHRGVVFPAFPMLLREVAHVNDPAYDPVWSACQELGVPLCLHVGSSPGVRLPPHPEMAPALRAALEAMTRPVSGVSDVVNLLFSRILLRFPRLQVIFAESALGWGAFLLEYADHQFDQDHCEGYELKPSEMFRRQCFLTGWYDPVQPAVQHLGAENLLWCTNFPLPTSPWPMSQQTIQRCFVGVGEPDRHRILWGNAARLYGLPLEHSLPPGGGGWRVVENSGGVDGHSLPPGGGG